MYVEETWVRARKLRKNRQPFPSLRYFFSRKELEDGNRYCNVDGYRHYGRNRADFNYQKDIQIIKTAMKLSALLQCTSCGRKIGLLLIETFRRVFNPHERGHLDLLIGWPFYLSVILKI
jgi:hypothetical protein